MRTKIGEEFMKLMPGIKVSENKIQCTEIKQGSKLGSKLGLNLGSQIRIEIKEVPGAQDYLEIPQRLPQISTGSPKMYWFLYIKPLDSF